jgi:type VI secretion system protein
MNRPVLLLMLLWSLAGCGLFGGGPKAVKPGWKALSLVATEEVNANSALAVDIVLVRDSKLLDLLLAMPAAKYFSASSALQRSYPGQMAVLAYEITPGQRIDIPRASFSGDKVWAALAFANYATPGEHRARLQLDPDQLSLRFDADDFSATPAAASR